MRIALSISGLALVAALLVATTISPATAQTPYTQRVRVGSGAALIDSVGDVWSADRAYATGGFGYTDGDAYATNASIANTPDGALFQANRHAAAFAYR
ncbi:MAG TPA: hypothetical protein VGJ35_07665, partial [Burkholderiaceae bacterium]